MVFWNGTHWFYIFTVEPQKLSVYSTEEEEYSKEIVITLPGYFIMSSKIKQWVKSNQQDAQLLPTGYFIITNVPGNLELAHPLDEIKHRIKDCKQDKIKRPLAVSFV